MKLIAVLGWIDGFGADTYVYGIFDSLKNARKIVPKKLYQDIEPRWVEIPLNKKAVDLDWYEGKPLFHSQKTINTIKKFLKNAKKQYTKSKKKFTFSSLTN